MPKTIDKYTIERNETKLKLIIELESDIKKYFSNKNR